MPSAPRSHHPAVVALAMIAGAWVSACGEGFVLAPPSGGEGGNGAGGDVSGQATSGASSASSSSSDATSSGTGGNASGGSSSGGGTGTTDFCEAPGVVACYRFEGDATDGGAGSHDGAASGVAYVAGKSGMAAKLEAESSLQIPNDPAFATSDVSVELWVAPAVLPAPGTRRGLVDHEGVWGLFLYDDGVRCSGGGGQTVGVPIPADAWSHVACTIGGGTIRVYVDGVEQSNVAHSALSTAASTVPLEVGANAPSGDARLVGRVDELRFFNVVRSPAAIAEAATP